MGTASPRAPRHRTARPYERPRGRPRARRAAATPLTTARRRLAALNLAVVFAILAVMAAAVYLADARASDQQVNAQLVAAASHDATADLLDTSAGAPDPDANDSADRYAPSSPNVFVLVLNPQGRVVVDPGQVSALGLPDRAAAAPVLAGAVTSTLVTTTRAGHEYRLYTVPLRAKNAITGVVQVGMSLDARDRQLHDLLLLLLLVGVGVLALTTGASFYLADHALGPLRLALERQRQFAAAASHELRTPLAFVRSQTELVARHLRRASAVPPERGGDVAGDVADLEDVLAEVDYMARLVQDLLLLARDEDDAASLRHQPVDLAALAVELVERLAPLARERGLALHAAAAPVSPVIVRGDPDRLRQLLLILVENALRYTPAGGAVRVSVSRADGSHRLGAYHRQARVSVSDDGAGIAPEDLPRIFEPFYRGTARVAERPTEASGAHGGSAGLGLALARWIVAAHGGAITVTSAPDEGSTFTVALPLAEAAAETP